MEPSAAEMLGLVRTIRGQKVGALFTEPQYPAKVGETVAREAKIPVAVLDPVATGKDGAPLDFYQQAMRQNLEILKKVLGTTDG
jgi:ABC-type Zn uptake system ZnuABC Zn-binding protein ZnuA